MTPVLRFHSGDHSHIRMTPIKQKSPDFSVESALLFSTRFVKQSVWFQPCDLHTLCLTNRFVCNFLSSSAGLNLCSCFFRLTLALRFRFRFRLLGLSVLNFSVPHRTCMYYYRNQQMSTPIFCIFRLLYCA